VPLITRVVPLNRARIARCGVDGGSVTVMLTAMVWPAGTSMWLCEKTAVAAQHHDGRAQGECAVVRAHRESREEDQKECEFAHDVSPW
jgi:hypothetical protein